MLGLVAENAALEDGLYYLDQGVTDGATTVDEFLAQVRKLARKQFIARATMKKVGEMRLVFVAALLLVCISAPVGIGSRALSEYFG